jgi:hypothetical protein
MKHILPSREAAAAKGWTHQVQWMEDGVPCFARFYSGEDADICADGRKAFGAVVIDLRDALQLH